MILPNEWQQEAEKYSWAINDQESYLDGATAYKQAVEKMLNDEIPNSKAQEPFIKHLLSKLQTLKPTLND